MNKVLVLFYAGVIVAGGVQNAFDPIVELYKNGAIPTIPILNDIIDEAVVIFRQENDNKIKLPDIKQKFGEKQHSVELQLTDGQFYGFDTLYRGSEATIKVNKNLVYQKTRYVIKKLTIEYDIEVKDKDKCLNGKIVAEYFGFAFISIFSLDRHSSKIHFLSFEFEHNDSIDIKVKGKINDDLQISRKIKSILPILKNYFKEIAEDQVKQVVSHQQDDFNYNVEKAVKSAE